MRTKTLVYSVIHSRLSSYLGLCCCRGLVGLVCKRKRVKRVVIVRQLMAFFHSFSISAARKTLLKSLTSRRYLRSSQLMLIGVTQSFLISLEQKADLFVSILLVQLLMGSPVYYFWKKYSFFLTKAVLVLIKQHFQLWFVSCVQGLLKLIWMSCYSIFRKGFDWYRRYRP